MKLYEYMIVYSHDRGMGRACVTKEVEINSYSDIENLNKKITKHNGFEVIIIDFKLLRIYEKTDNIFDEKLGCEINEQ